MKFERVQIQNSDVPNISTQISMNKIDYSEVDIKKQVPTEAAIQVWLVSYLSKVLELNPDKMDIKATFDRYGLDSLITVTMTSDLEQWLGYEVDPSLPYSYSSIESLANYLAEKYKI